MAILNLNTLQSLVPPTVFGRGARYAEAGQVFHLSREGDWLTASVLGAEEYPVRLGLTAPYHSDCACRYAGVCEHAVAAGLAWLEVEQADVAPSLPQAGGPSLHRLVAGLSQEELVALVREMLDSADAAGSVVQQFLVRRGGAPQDDQPGEAASEADVIGQKVREWLSQIPLDGGPDEFDESEDPEFPQEGVLSDSEKAISQIDDLVDSLCQPQGPQSVPSAVPALCAVAVELLAWLGEGENAQGDEWLDRVADQMVQLAAEPHCPVEVVWSAVTKVVAAAVEAAYVPPSLERFVLEAAGMHEALRSPLTRGLVSSESDWAIRMAALIVAHHEGPRSALAGLKQVGGSERAYMAIARYCAQNRDHDGLRDACSLAAEAAHPAAQAETRREAAALLMQEGLRSEGMALLMENFRGAPSHWTCTKVLNAATPEERGEYARRMLELSDPGADLELGLALHLAAGNPGAAADLISDPTRTRPDKMAQVAAALAAQDLNRAILLWWDAATAVLRSQNRLAYGQAAGWLAAIRSALLDAGRAGEWDPYREQLVAQYPEDRALHAELQKAGAW